MKTRTRDRVCTGCMAVFPSDQSSCPVCHNKWRGILIESFHLLAVTVLAIVVMTAMDIREWWRLR